MSTDLADKVNRELATKYGYLPSQAKQVLSFVKGVHGFSHYLGSNKYYSDSLNKRIALLSLDSDILMLRADRVRLTGEGFYTSIELALTGKGKPALDKKKVDEFKRDLDGIQQEALGIHARALELMTDIKREYASKEIA